MANLMAFGTRRNAMWVLAPKAPLSEPVNRFVANRELPDGSMTLRSSTNLRKRFEFSWSGNDLEVQAVRDIRRGRYGHGPWLFIHPRALLGNLLVPSWSQFNRAVGVRGMYALDNFTGPVSFSGTMANNPNEAACALTGATGLPATGARIWSATNTPPVVPAVTGSRPHHTVLVPPNYGGRLTVWGVQNDASSPGLYYALSTVSPTNTTVPAGTLVKPTPAGGTATFAPGGGWRVLDIWIGAGSSTTANQWTVFGAADFRLRAGDIPDPVADFDYGRGQFPVHFTENSMPEEVTMVGRTPERSHYQLDGPMQEVALPW